MGDLFESYRKRLKPPQATVERECAIAIKEVTTFDISAEAISYTVATKTVSIQVPSVMKSEIFLHKKAILNVLKERLGSSAPEALL